VALGGVVLESLGDGPVTLSPRCAASNSFFAWPMERASFGIRSAPKSKTAMPTIMAISGPLRNAKIGVMYASSSFQLAWLVGVFAKCMRQGFKFGD